MSRKPVTPLNIRAFVSAGFALTMIFAAAGAPIPLYETYRSEYGFQAADLAVATVAYLVSVMGSLLVLGRLSDHLGRRIVTVAALGVAIAGCALLLFAHDVGTLTGARALQGLACGLGVTAVASYIVETAPARPSWLAANAAASSPVIGLTIGPVGAAALSHFSSTPTNFVFVVVGILLVIGVILVASSPESAPRRAGAWRSLRPQIQIPQGARRILPAVTAIYIAVWAVGAFYLSFSPMIVAGPLRTDNTLLQTAMFVCFMAPSALGGPLTGHFSARTAQRIGITILVAGVVGMAVCVWLGNLPAALVASSAAGIGQGAAMTAGIRALISATQAQERAGALAAVYMLSYTVAASLSLTAGQVSRVISLQYITFGYAVAVIVAGTTVVWLSCRQLADAQR